MYAQKNIDIDTEYFTAQFRDSPVQALNPLFFYYSKAIKATPSTKSRVDLDAFLPKFAIEGQLESDEKHPPKVVANLILDNLIINKSEVKEHMTEYKDKEGKVRRDYSYSLYVDYSFGAELHIWIDGKQTKAIPLIASNLSRTYDSQEYSSRSDAAKLWNDNKDVMICNFAKAMTEEAVKGSTSYLSHQYGFSETKKSETLKTMDEKKHPENLILRSKVTELKSLLASLTPDKGLSESDLQPFIDYFSAIPSKYADPKLKADIKLRYIAFYNLAKIYIYLDQPAKAIVAGDPLYANEHDKKDGEKLKKEAMEVQAILDRTSVKTRHFAPDAMAAK
jgi:hypothetical protein